MGANTTLASPTGDVVVTHRHDEAVDVNLTSFLVGADGKVRSDADMVFYNQPQDQDGVARYHAPTTVGDQVEHRLSFDLARLPAGVEKIVVSVTEDRAGGFSSVQGLAASVVTGGVTTRFSPVPAFSTEKGLVVAEVYVRGGQHKVRAVWQGFASGLHGLATDHGVDVEAPEETPAAPAPPPAAPSAPSPISFTKVTGKVEMKKGDKPVSMEKTAKITASVSWRSGTDYDVYALVMTRDGRQVDVAAFGADGVPVLMDFGGGAVRHLGDVQRASGDQEQVESIELRLNPEILAVVPVAYSAQSNGSGSFRKYNVSLSIDNHAGTRVDVSAKNANKSNVIYSCVPGIIHNTDDGVVIEPLELYSDKGSENRPKLALGSDGKVTVQMDAGPKNDYK